MLQTVGHEAGYVLLAVDGLLAADGHQLHGLVHDPLLGDVRLDDLNQGNQVTGVPEVGAHDTLGVLALGADLGAAHDGGVGGQNALVGAVLLDVAEQVLLGLHDLGGALDDEVGVGVSLGLVNLEVDALQNGSLLLFGSGAAGDHDVQVVDDHVPAILTQSAGLQGDMQIGVGSEDLSQGVAHHAAADNHNILNVHWNDLSFK